MSGERIAYVITTGKTHSSVYAKRSTWLATLVALWAVVWKEHVIALVIPTMLRVVSRISVLVKWWNKELFEYTTTDVAFAAIKTRRR
jgi:hypothetical protein